MVAHKKGRGAKAQAAKAKAAAAAAAEEQQIAETELDQTVEEENNGDAEEELLNDSNAGQEADGEQAQGTENQENADGETKADEKKEEKVESGKLLVENLPVSYLFEYQEKLKEIFSKHGEVLSVKRGPIIVTELTTTPTLSAIVEFKNKESLDQALTEEGTVVDGYPISVAIESRPETAVLVGVPYEASTDYVRLLFSQCGEVTHIHEFSKTKYKILRVTFQAKEAVEKAMKLDRELRMNGFRITVTRYRDEDDQKVHNANQNKQNKRPHPSNQNRNSSSVANNSPNAPNANRAAFRGRGAFTPRGNFRGARARGSFGGRGSFGRGGFAPVASYMPPQPFMGRPGGFMNDGQRPNKRLRQM